MVMQRQLLSFVVGFFLVALPSSAGAMSIGDAFHSFWCVIENMFGHECYVEIPVAIPPAPVVSQQTPPVSSSQHPFHAEDRGDVLGEATASPEVQTEDASPAPTIDTSQFIGRGEFEIRTAALRSEFERMLLQTRATTSITQPQLSPPSSITYVSSGGSSRSYDGDIQDLWRALSLTNKIDRLGDVDIERANITESNFSGDFSGNFSGTFSGTIATTSSLSLSGPFSATSISATTISGTSLSLTGALTAATTTSAIIDKQGQVCNVQAYGAVGDNSTDNYAAIVAAINACPASGIVYFPPGVYRISQTINLDKPITLEGTYAPRWSYDSAPRTSIKPTTPFTGGQIIHVREHTISGQSANNDGGRIENISIDGNSFGSGVIGIYFEGLVRDWKLMNVDISQTSGEGFDSAQGTGTGNARGFTIQHLSIYSPGSHGFRATALNDSYIDDVLVVGGALRGFYLTSMGETKIVNSRSVFNALEGLYIDGASNNGGLQIAEFSTDRNDRHGVRISATGTTTITFTGLLIRRDGANNGGGTDTPYAGVSIVGTPGLKVAPVIISGLTQIPGRDDSGNGTAAPLTGLRVEYATYVQVDGVLWGTTNPYVDNGNNDNFIISEDTLLKTGFNVVTSARYNKKWMVASSTNALVYTGSIGIGTTSPTAQLHTTGTVRFSNFGAGTLQTDANGNVSVSSDERLKDIQGQYATGLAALLKINPILYHWNATSGFDTQTQYAGFSAQNVKEAIPEAVGEDPHGFLTLSDRPILAAVVNAIKELWDKVTGNTQKIGELEQRIAVLEHQLNVVPPQSQTAAAAPVLAEQASSTSPTSTASSTPAIEPINNISSISTSTEATSTQH